MSDIPEQEKGASPPPTESKDAASPPDDAPVATEPQKRHAPTTDKPPSPPPEDLSGEDASATRTDDHKDSNKETNVHAGGTTPKERRFSTIPGIACSCVALLLFLLAYFMATSVGSLAREASRAATQAQPAVVPVPTPAAPVPTPLAPAASLLLTPPAPAVAVAVPSVPPGQAIDAAAAWQAAVGRNINAIFQTASAKYRLIRLNWWITKPEAFSLRVPFWLILIGFLLLVAGSGLVLGGDAFLGVVDPNTGCSSLSRVQALAWTGVILGGFSVMALCNIAFGAAAAVAAGTDVSLFPGLDADLLLLLGIVAGSPIFATYVSANAQKQPETKDSKSFRNRIYQIMIDDNAADQGKPDLTRLQCIFMTIILLGCYGAMLDQSLAAINAAVISAAASAAPPRPLFTTLPPITGSFMVLLAASHTIFQVSKSQWGQQFTRKPGP